MTRSIPAAAAAAGLATVATLFAAPAIAADLLVEVRGVRSDSGRIQVAIHTSREKAGFPSAEGMYAGFYQQAHEGSLRFVLRDLPAGRYALTAFHDENGNGDLDANVLGIPKEGSGFANDPTAYFGPPSFEAAAVTVGDAPVTAAMTINY